MNQQYFPVLLGTKRKSRESEKVANWLMLLLNAKKEIRPELFDTREMDFSGSEGQDLKDKNAKWRDAVIRADGIIIIAPEYNHGYSGSLKMALDMLLKEYIHKPVAIVGVSASGFGGTRVIESLVPVVRELGMVVTFSDLNVSKVIKAFDVDGKPTDGRMDDRAMVMIDELLWMAKTLRWGRENLKSKYH